MPFILTSATRPRLRLCCCWLNRQLPLRPRLRRCSCWLNCQLPLKLRYRKRQDVLRNAPAKGYIRIVLPRDLLPVLQLLNILSQCGVCWRKSCVKCIVTITAERYWHPSIVRLRLPVCSLCWIDRKIIIVSVIGRLGIEQVRKSGGVWSVPWCWCPLSSSFGCSVFEPLDFY